MIKYIIKHIRRGIISNILFCLLLGLAGALLCISAGLWFSSFYALRDLDDTITTIAMPDPFFIEQFAEDNEISRDEVLHYLRETVYGSGLFLQDDRRIFNAIADDIRPIPLRATGVGVEPSMIAYTAKPIAAFVVTCEKIDSNHHYVNYFDEETGENLSYINRVNFGAFYVDDVIFLNDAYTKPRYINITFNLNPDGSSPFELRKQYIVMGNYTPGGGFTGGFSALALNFSDVPVQLVTTGTITTEDELFELFSSAWYSWMADLLPLDVNEIIYDQIVGPGGEEFGFFELTGSMEDAMASPEQAWMVQALEDAEISSHSFQVLTTNDPLSLLRLNQRRNLFEEGRTFTAQELRSGARVCLISRAFAEFNELEIGDTIPLELYAAVFGSSFTTFVPYEVADPITQRIWIPSMYQRDLEITQPIEYTIVGIMNIVPGDSSDHAISRNMVIIPEKSFEGTHGEPVSLLPVPDFIPLLEDGIIVPNGRIEATRDAINGLVPGYAGLLRFFDQGYGSVKTALDNLQFGLSWILGLAVAVWLAIAYLFSFFFTSRKRREAAVLNAVGVGKISRFFWVFIQSSIPIILSLGISLALTLPLYEYIIEAAVEITQEFTESFRDLTLSDAADSGIRRTVPLEASPISLILSAVTGIVILLVITGFMSARSVVFKTLSSGKDI